MDTREDNIWWLEEYYGLKPEKLAELSDKEIQHLCDEIDEWKEGYRSIETIKEIVHNYGDKKTSCPKCGWAFRTKEYKTQTCKWCGTHATVNDLKDDVPY